MSVASTYCVSRLQTAKIWPLGTPGTQRDDGPQVSPPPERASVTWPVVCWTDARKIRGRGPVPASISAEIIHGSGWVPTRAHKGVLRCYTVGGAALVSVGDLDPLHEHIHKGLLLDVAQSQGGAGPERLRPVGEVRGRCSSTNLRTSSSCLRICGTCSFSIDRSTAILSRNTPSWSSRSIDLVNGLLGSLWTSRSCDFIFSFSSLFFPPVPGRPSSSWERTSRVSRPG